MSGHDDGKPIDYDAEMKRLDREYSIMTWLVYGVVVVCITGIFLMF